MKIYGPLMFESSALPTYKLFMRFFVTAGRLLLRSKLGTHKKRCIWMLKFAFAQVPEFWSTLTLLLCRYTETKRPKRSLIRRARHWLPLTPLGRARLCPSVHMVSKPLLAHFGRANPIPAGSDAPFGARLVRSPPAPPFLPEEVQLAAVDMFVTTLTGLIVYLQRQQNLTAELKTTCLKFVSTCWLSMRLVTEWLVKHPVQVLEYLQDKK